MKHKKCLKNNIDDTTGILASTHINSELPVLRSAFGSF